MDPLTLLHDMDSGVRRLVVDITNMSDKSVIAYAFVRREFAFEGIAEDVVDEATLYPRGPFLVCTVLSLREFIEQFPFLGKQELNVIAKKHGIKFRSCLTIRMHIDALRRHACVPLCGRVLYKFQPLNRPRKVIFVPSQDEPRDPLDEITDLRQKEKKWSRAYRRRQGGGELEIDLSVEYPPVRTFEEKSAIIHQWQAYTQGD